MAIAVPISKCGSFTIPPEIRKRLGVDQLENPMLLVEERDGKLYLEPAAAVPVRDIPKATLRAWIKSDEAEMTAFKKSAKRRKWIFSSIPACYYRPVPLPCHYPINNL